MSRRLAPALALALLAASAGGARALGPHAAGGTGAPHVEWPALADSAARAATRDSAALAHSLARWRARLAEPASTPTALHVLGALAAAAGDSAGADSCWAALGARPGVWQWDALEHHAAFVLGRRGAAAADSLLAPVERGTWTDAERAAWLATRARLRAAAGDTAQAATLARQLLVAYPGISAPAQAGLALLDSIARARGDSLAVDDLRAGAEVDALRAARGAAIAKLRRVLARTPRAERFAVALRIATLLREARMPLAAGAQAESAQALARTPAERDRALLERARAWRDAARTDSAFAAYARLARRTGEPALRSSAWWETAREAEDRGRYREALVAFAHVAQSGDRRADDARFRAGLAQFVLGNADSARTWWRTAHGEAPRFWLAIALRATDRAASDTLLAELAARPGYAFYRAAARETLGVRGWPGEVSAEPAVALPVADDVRALVADGRDADAGRLLARWAGGDPRAGAVRDAGADDALAGAALALDVGRVALATRLAERAFSAAAADSDAWRIVPWAYPPAYARETSAAAAASGIEPALLWALARQESRFDPLARSRSDALGLTQLKLATAGDVARALHEREPAEGTLLAPGPSLRYGAHYLAGLAKRFEGSVPVALAAYNAGASTIRADWRALLARGGEALYAEYASNADSQDYVRRILGFRQAYRELAPAPAP